MEQYISGWILFFFGCFVGGLFVYYHMREDRR